MLSPRTAPALYAVLPSPTSRVATAPAPIPAHHRNIGELRTEKLSELRTKKAIDRAASLLDRLAAREAAYASAIAKLAKRKALACARIANVEDEIMRRMQDAGLDHIDGFRESFSIRPATCSVQIDDESLIPDAFMRRPKAPASAPDKVAIKAALSRGEEVAGVHLTQKLSLLRK